MPAIKGNAELVGQFSTYESAEAALLDLSTKGWGPNWREQAAGSDQAKLAELRRYQTPGAAIEALFAGKERIRQGDLARPLPENPNEQEVQAYRQAQGVPEKPEGYSQNLPQGLVLGEADKPVYDSLMADLHKVHTPPRIAHAILGWYNKQVEAEIAAVAEQDSRDREEMQTQLRQDWGGDYKANVNINKNYLATLPQKLQDAIGHARDEDGRGLLNNVEFMNWMTTVARSMMDSSALLPDTSGGNLKTVASRIAEIEGVMSTDRKRYNADKGMQDELEKLYETRERINEANKNRGRAA